MQKEKENTQTIDILQKKKELLLNILDISRKQEQYLKNDEVETLLEAIQIRQGYIDEITGLEKDIKAIGLSQHPSYQTDKAKKLLDDMKNILKEIADLDKGNCEAAEEKVEQYKRQIREIKNNKSIIDLYKPLAGSTDGLYIDKKK